MLKKNLEFLRIIPCSNIGMYVGELVLTNYGTLLSVNGNNGGIGTIVWSSQVESNRSSVLHFGCNFGLVVKPKRQDCI